MHSPIAQSLDAVASWRVSVERHVDALERTLAEHGLLDDAERSLLATLRERLACDKLVLAFVAEFSRGKSELINAIFFADAGLRVLPATPGRTTMCPVELRFDAAVPPRLSLLPIETRLGGLGLAELRMRDASWQHVPLDPDQPQSLARSLAEVTRTQRVSLDQARALGLWSDLNTGDNPPQSEDGSVDVPAWRHALIHYPHPLLQRGLVVIDTPGLNAIGAEPELTLGLLPMAHAIVFVLGADTGVTRSDLAIWRDHLGASGLERFVAMNKIDTLADPLASGAEVAGQIEQQARQSAQILGVPRARVFPLSARDALAARLQGDEAGLDASGLLPLEHALAGDLLSRQQALLVRAAASVVAQLHSSAARRLVDRRRMHAEQLFELRGLRGKSGAKLRMMLARIDVERVDFERCTGRLAALRSVQMRMQRSALALLSSEVLRTEVAALHASAGARLLKLGGRADFDALMARLYRLMAAAQSQADELRQMLVASFGQLNAEFGFAFVITRTPSLAQFEAEVRLIEKSYGRYFDLSALWRMAMPGFAEQLRRMLLSKLRMAFENAAGEIEVWSKAAAGQVELQLRERQRGFERRREAMLRVQSAAGELEQGINEVQLHDEQLRHLQRRVEHLSAAAEAAVHAMIDEDLPATGRAERSSGAGLASLRQSAA